MEPPPAPPSPPSPPSDPRLLAEGAAKGDDTGRLLRPYAITGGRTAVPASLNLESQLRRTDRVDVGVVPRWEAARILELAGRPIAVVEIAARVGLPVGVAKVVIADLLEQGALTTGAAPPTPSESSFSSLLEKVLDGLDRL
jgi:Protein of unknown function (DUF742)